VTFSVLAVILVIICTRGKWNPNGMKKGKSIDKLGYINLLDAITHVEIGRTIKCVLYNISYDFSISFHYTFCFLCCFFLSFVLFRVLTNTSRFVSTYNFFLPVFLPFRRLSGENN
jgi:hypothetical protein